eukprot:s3399_g3.t1
MANSTASQETGMQVLRLQQSGGNDKSDVGAASRSQPDIVMKTLLLNSEKPGRRDSGLIYFTGVQSALLQWLSLQRVFAATASLQAAMWEKTRTLFAHLRTEVPRGSLWCLHDQGAAKLPMRSNSARSCLLNR